MPHQDTSNEYQQHMFSSRNKKNKYQYSSAEKSTLTGAMSIGKQDLTHCILNRLSRTIYWKSPISILGTSSYEIYIFLREKWLNYLQTVETLIRCHVLWCLIWVCTVCQLPFYGSPDYNGLIKHLVISTVKACINLW